MSFDFSYIEDRVAQMAKREEANARRLADLANQLHQGQPIITIGDVPASDMADFIHRLSGHILVSSDPRAMNLLLDYVLQQEERGAAILARAPFGLTMAALRRGIVPPPTSGGGSKTDRTFMELATIAPIWISLPKQVASNLIPEKTLTARLLFDLGEFPSMNWFRDLIQYVGRGVPNLDATISHLLARAGPTRREWYLAELRKYPDVPYVWWLGQRFGPPGPALDAAVGRNLAHYLTQRI